MALLPTYFISQGTIDHLKLANVTLIFQPFTYVKV